MNYRHLRTPQGAGITAAGRAILVGAGSSRGTEVNININGDQETPEEVQARHDAYLAAALGIDRCEMVLQFFRIKQGDAWVTRMDNCMKSLLSTRPLNSSDS